MSVIKGSFSWVKIVTPDVYKGTSKWKVDITVDKGTAAALVADGKNSTKKDPLTFTFYRKCLWPDGSSKNQPKVLGIDKGALVGNGSEGRLQYSVVEGKTKDGEDYKLFDLQGIRIDKLVSYAIPDGAELEDEDDKNKDGGELGKLGDAPEVPDDIPF